MSEVPTPRRVVVGVDGSPASVAALRWALREARLRCGAVYAVRAWEARFAALAPYAPVRGISAEEERQVAGASLAEAVRRARSVDADFDVELHEVLTRGSAPQVLLREAAGAELLVLGGHRASSPLVPTLGATAAACVRRAPCPVVLVGVDSIAEPESHELEVVARHGG